MISFSRCTNSNVLYRPKYNTGLYVFGCHVRHGSCVAIGVYGSTFLYALKFENYSFNCEHRICVLLIFSGILL